MNTDMPAPTMCFEENIISGEITAISSAGGYARLELYADEKHGAAAMNKSLGISPEQAEQIKLEHYKAINSLRVEHEQHVATMGERMEAANIVQPVIDFNDDGMRIG